MSKHGQNNQAGIFVQNWAAFSLFLQHLKNPGFSHIELEGENSEDFTLHFNDGHKIICESKARKERFSYSHLKALIINVLQKNQLQGEDEILVVCTNIDKKMREKLEFFYIFAHPDHEYWKYLSKKGFSDQQIDAIKYVRFWLTKNSEEHEKACYALISELISFWLPEEDIKEFIRSIWAEDIVKGSTKAKIFTRAQLIILLTNKKDDLRKKSGYWDKEKREISQMVKELQLSATRHKDPAWSSGPLSAIASQPGLMLYALEKIQAYISKSDKSVEIANWREVWQTQNVIHYAFKIFDIFKSSLDNAKNREFVLNFIIQHFNKFRDYFRGDLYEMQIVEILEIIIEKKQPNQREIHDLYSVIQEILNINNEEYFYSESVSSEKYSKEQLCRLLEKIYIKGSNSLKQKIFEQLFETFDLIIDGSRFYMRTPSEAYNIVYLHLVSDPKKFQKLFTNLIERFSRQHDKGYRDRYRFKGWDLAAGGTGSMNGVYSVSDKHFVEDILTPILNDYYSKNRKKAWNFILKTCISTQEKKISRKRPDFLNRAAIRIVVKRYIEGSEIESDEAFGILCSFIDMRGIPWKLDLIYQELKAYKKNEEKLFKFMEKTLNVIKTPPINPFFDSFVIGFLSSENIEMRDWAKKILKAWFSDPKYLNHPSLSRREINQTIGDILSIDPQFGLEILKDFIASDYFKQTQEHFGVYGLADSINSILRSNFDVGLGLLKPIIDKEQPSENEQDLFAASLLRNKEEVEGKVEFITKIYENLLLPFFNRHQFKNSEIIKQFTSENARIEIVKFSEKLIELGKIEEALNIIGCFIDDPDPLMPHDEADTEKLKYNEHQKILNGEESPSITSVRGFCAWILAKSLCEYARAPLLIERIITYIKQLSKDRNYYVLHMTSYPLRRLAQLRFAHMGDSSTLFFDIYGREKALLKAQEIEVLAFDYMYTLGKISESKARNEMSKSLMQVFGMIRTLNTFKAHEFITFSLEYSEKSAAEVVPLLLYYAFLRKERFNDWKWQTKGLYDNLNDFDPTDFIKLFDDLIDKGQPEVLSRISHQCLILIDDSKRYNDPNLFQIALEIINKLLKNFCSEPFGHLFRIISDMMESDHFDKGYKLFQIWLERVESEDKSLSKMGYLLMDNFLSALRSRGTDDQFLEIFERLSTLFKSQGYINYIAPSIQELIKLRDHRVETILSNLVELDPKYFDLLEEYKLKNQPTS